MKQGQAPNFLIPGASRSGTSSLYYYLREHDDIFMPETKELRFFDRDENYRRGLDYYEQQFADWCGERAVGESSPPYWNRGITFDEQRNYQWRPDDAPPRRIAEAYPDLDIIITLRNPVTRLHSQFWKNVRQGREKVLSLKQALEMELSGERDHRHSELCWVYRNRHPVHLKRWFELFDRRQIRVIIFEEWIGQPQQTLSDLCRFLGVDPEFSFSRTNRKQNTSCVPRSMAVNNFYHRYLEGSFFGEVVNKLNLKSGKPPMGEEVKRFAYSIFEDDVREMETLLDRPLDVWKMN